MVHIGIHRKLTASPGLPAAPCAPDSPYRKAGEGALGCFCFQALKARGQPAKYILQNVDVDEEEALKGKICGQNPYLGTSATRLSLASIQTGVTLKHRREHDDDMTIVRRQE